MNILLACKAEPDLTMLAEQDWLAAEQGQLDVSATRPSPGMDEQAAAEIVLRHAAERADTHLSVVSIGDRRAESLLRQFKALGFQQAALIHTQSECRFASQSVAALLAAWQQNHPQSLIVLGSLSAEGNNGQTAFWLAEMLGWPCFSQVCDFHIDAENQLIAVTQNLGGTRHRLTARLPAVISVVNDGQYCLRTPTLRQKLAVSADDVVIIQAETLGHRHDTARRCLRMTRNKTRRAGVIIEGNDATEKARRLYQDWLRNRMTS